MKKIYTLVPMALTIAVLFSACGKEDINSSSNSKILSNSSIPSSEDNAIVKDNNNKNKENDSSSETLKPEEKNSDTNQKIFKATIDAKSGYADNKRQVNVIGLKSYKKLKSKLYKDEASKNKKFLVLFLEITNTQNDKDYINVNYLSTKIDGKEIKNSVLFNEPEGFQTIFKNIEPGETLRGFIVWEVPGNWKKIEIIYDGWKDSSNLSLDCTFTPDDYFDPPQYN